MVEVPQLEAGASLPPSGCLQVLPAVEAYGMAWVSLEPQPPAPIPTIAEFEDSRFDRIEIGVIRYHASAAAIIDNNTDSTHVAFVHSGSFGAEQDPRVPVAGLTSGNIGNLRDRQDGGDQLDLLFPGILQHGLDDASTALLIGHIGNEDVGIEIYPNRSSPHLSCV